jgi:hypothetical protein
METIQEITSKKFNDDDYFTLEMVERIKHAEQQIQEGKGIRVSSKEELKKFLDSL